MKVSTRYPCTQVLSIGGSLDSKRTLLTVLESRHLSVDPTAIKLLNDQQLIRLWNASGDLIYYNEAMKKVTSYTPLDLCYYDLKTLWRFEDEGYEKFKTIVARALLGKELAMDRIYTVRENMGSGHGARHMIEIAVPVLSGDKIEGVLIAGRSELLKKTS